MPSGLERIVLLSLVCASATCRFDPGGVRLEADALDMGPADGSPVDASRDAAADCMTLCADGTCQDGVCVITCGTLDGCPTVVVCPAGLPCEVRCSAIGSCAGGIDCSMATSCAVQCSGTDSCANEVICGAGPCDVACSGPMSCDNGVTCDQACRCEVTCGAQACGDAAMCPMLECQTGLGCTDAPADCDNCSE